jgi:Flp pilus assembly protein TadB
MDPIAVSGLIAVILIGFWVLIADTGGSIDQAAIADRLAGIAPDTTKNEPDEVIRMGLPSQVRAGRVLATLREVRFLATLEQTMWQAGVHLSLPSMLAMMLVMIVAGCLAGQFLAHDVTLAIATGAALGLVPLFYVRWCAERRRQAFVRQLPAALDFVKSAI